MRAKDLLHVRLSQVIWFESKMFLTEAFADMQVDEYDNREERGIE